MRGTRWLLLVAIVAIIGVVGITYRAQKKTMAAEAPAKPAALPDGLSALADGYFLSQSRANDNRCPKSDIAASSFRRSEDSSQVSLTDVTLRVYNKECKAYDLIKSAAAAYFERDKRLYSEGNVLITLNVPMEGKSKHELVTIQTSGATFDTATGKAETDRPSTFTFENGEGHATGASYDPESHELQLKSDVVLHRHPPNVKPMTIEAGHLVYHEAAAEVLLSPWGRFTRGDTVVEGENPVIKLQNREVVKQVHTTKAHGIDNDPKRKLQYAADDLLMDFDDKGEVQHITGDSNARLFDASATGETTVTSDHVDLNFEVKNKESLLAHVGATGHAIVMSKPLPAPGRDPKDLSETHILRSENLEMKMRTGGRELDQVVTHGPGVLDFLPNQPTQHHRNITGNDMLIGYGAQNHIDSFHATSVKTQTDPDEDQRKHGRAVSFTSSNELSARFEPKTNRMAAMDQKGSFVYDEGDRHARATRATLDSKQNIIVLEGGARMWDTSGSTTAERIRTDQSTGDFVADGNVNSSRMPDKDPKKNSQMLNGDQPLQAQAQHMESTNKNKTVRYRNKAVMWQGANRIEADSIDVEMPHGDPGAGRVKRGLVADGSVICNLWQEPKDEDKKKGATPIRTVVRAPHMVYTDEDRLAVYTGGVTLERPNLKEKSRELRAYLADSGADSRLEKAFADGAVEIVQAAPGKTRTGTAEHSEYFVNDQKVILRGGDPKLVDDKGGFLQANELTYFANDDRLLGVGGANQPAQSQILRHRK